MKNNWQQYNKHERKYLKQILLTKNNTVIPETPSEHARISSK